MTQRSLREAALTDVGRVRDHNEDNMGVLLSQNLYIVADGMGGHAAGEVASQIAVDALMEFFQEPPERGARGAGLSDAIELANLKIFQEGAQQSSKRGMGTTIVAMRIQDEQAHLAHVGDSRIYRVREDQLEQVTTDHSWFAEVMANAEHLDPEMIAHAERYKNVITRALGMNDAVEVDVSEHELEPGDLFLLCSDGLHDMISDEKILETILEHRQDLSLCCERLIEAANRAGGVDNITVVLVDADAAVERTSLGSDDTVARDEES